MALKPMKRTTLPTLVVTGRPNASGKGTATAGVKTPRASGLAPGRPQTLALPS